MSPCQSPSVREEDRRSLWDGAIIEMYLGSVLADADACAHSSQVQNAKEAMSNDETQAMPDDRMALPAQ